MSPKEGCRKASLFRHIYMACNETYPKETLMDWKTRLKQEWNENPMQVLLVGAMVAGAAAKLLDAASGVRSRNAYARRMNRPPRRRK